MGVLLDFSCEGRLQQQGTTVTHLLSQSVPRGHVQHLSGHAG